MCVSVCDWKCLMSRMKNNYVARARDFGRTLATQSAKQTWCQHARHTPQFHSRGAKWQTNKFIQQWNEPHNWIKYYACIFLYAKWDDRRRRSIPLSLTVESVLAYARRARVCILAVESVLKSMVARTMNGNASIVYILPTMHGLRFRRLWITHDLNVQRSTSNINV